MKQKGDENMAVHSDRKNKISFAKLEEILNSKNKTWGYLREQGISPGIVAKMKDGTGDISTKTIERVCELMECQPGDFMEYKESDTE